MRQNLEWGMMLLPENCTDFMRRHHAAFSTAKGGTTHQAYPGGFEDHLDECFGIAGKLYWSLEELRPLPFTLGDAILALWLHDIEKPWKNSHVLRPLTNKLLATTGKKIQLTEEIVDELRLPLQEQHWNAIKYAHGETDDYEHGKAKACPLAAFVNMCDYWSARGWPDEPMKSGNLRRTI